MVSGRRLAGSVLVLFAELFVGLFVHKIVEVGGVLDANLKDPAVFLGLVVNQGGVAFHILVVGGDFSCYWGVDVCCGLDTLDADDSVSLGEACSYICKIQMNDISELSLGEVSNANLCFLETYDVKDILPWSRC